MNVAALLLSSALAGCSSWSNPPQSPGALGSTLTPNQSVSSAPGQPLTPAATPPAISDGAHPNQSITDFVRDSNSQPSAMSDGVHPNQSLINFVGASSSPQSPNVPHPPSSYTPVGQPYSPPGQPAYGGSQAAGTTSAAASPPPPPTSDGAHPNQSITDLFRQ